MVLIIVAVILLQYMVSRFSSPWNAVAVFEDPTVESLRENDLRLRVACYNIAHGRGLVDSNWNGGTETERLERLELIADQLREMDADVVVLNEVDFDAAWSGGINQAHRLAKLAGYRYRIELRNIDLQAPFLTLRFGNAILSRFPLTEPALIDFPGYADWETVLAGKKQGVVATVSCGQQEYRIVAAHLSHRIEAVRVESATMIRELTLKSRLPVIIAGDMNSAPPGFAGSVSTSDGRNTITEFEKGNLFQRKPMQKPKTVELTFPADAPRLVIDWIMITRDLEFINYGVVDSMLSDHKAVTAEIRTRKQP